MQQRPGFSDRCLQKVAKVLRTPVLIIAQISLNLGLHGTDEDIDGLCALWATCSFQLHMRRHHTASKPGDNLDDPKNFSLMPPVELLSHRDPHDAGVRAQLQKAAIFAEKVLHTSKVRPAVWVAWRDFGRDAQKLLRGPTSTVAPVEPKPIVKVQHLAPKPLHVIPAIAKTPAAKSSPRSHGNKNVFGHFVDVAREWLPAATSATLNEKALAAKTNNPEMGFMKHFKRIAEIELPRAEFDRIVREASRRDGFTA